MGERSIASPGGKIWSWQPTRLDMVIDIVGIGSRGDCIRLSTLRNSSNSAVLLENELLESAALIAPYLVGR